MSRKEKIICWLILPLIGTVIVMLYINPYIGTKFVNRNAAILLVAMFTFGAFTMIFQSLNGIRRKVEVRFFKWLSITSIATLMTILCFVVAISDEVTEQTQNILFIIFFLLFSFVLLAVLSSNHIELKDKDK